LIEIILLVADVAKSHRSASTWSILDFGLGCFICYFRQFVVVSGRLQRIVEWNGFWAASLGSFDGDETSEGMNDFGLLESGRGEVPPMANTSLF